MNAVFRDSAVGAVKPALAQLKQRSERFGLHTLPQVCSVTLQSTSQLQLLEAVLRSVSLLLPYRQHSSMVVDTVLLLLAELLCTYASSAFSCVSSTPWYDRYILLLLDSSMH
jgi:hypothetical protein